MGASHFVGRVGGLAVALGVGAAVFSAAGSPRPTAPPRIPAVRRAPQQFDISGECRGPRLHRARRRPPPPPSPRRRRAVPVRPAPLVTEPTQRAGAGRTRLPRRRRPCVTPASAVTSAPAVNRSRPPLAVPAAERRRARPPYRSRRSPPRRRHRWLRRQPRSRPSTPRRAAGRPRRRKRSVGSGRCIRSSTCCWRPSSAAKHPGAAATGRGGSAGKRLVWPDPRPGDHLLRRRPAGQPECHQCQRMRNPRAPRCTLTYSFVTSSAGGKLNLDNVPAALPGLPAGAQGGAGSYTFLPYATWINPANPTNHPTPTGTQSFTVRVSENTKFDQTLTSIPLIGLFATPIISLLQQTPFIGNLLAPLIGASITQAVSVNVGLLVPAVSQVAYTYKVTSFDGTKISMNYFPASAPSLVLPGQYQATIFNGPGLGWRRRDRPVRPLSGRGIGSRRSA